MHLTFDELLRRPMIERYVTLACVSNEVGGDLIGNARWLGVPVEDLLDEVGPRPGADQVVSRSVDGFTAGTPTAVLRDGRDAHVRGRDERRAAAGRPRLPGPDGRARDSTATSRPRSGCPNWS